MQGHVFNQGQAGFLGYTPQVVNEATVCWRRVVAISPHHFFGAAEMALDVGDRSGQHDGIRASP